MDKAYAKKLGMGIVTARSRGMDDTTIVKHLATKPELRGGIQEAMSAGFDAPAIIKHLGGAYVEESDRIASRATDGMSTTDKVLAGMGSRFVDYKVAADQMMGVASTREADEKAALDKDLMDTTEGFVGSLLTDVATSAIAPAGAAGMGARVTAGAVGGGLFGAMDPVKTGESRAENVAISGGVGAAIPFLGKGITKIANARKGKLAKKFAENKEMLDLADELDVPISASQAGSTIGKALDAAEKYIPFSGRAKRADKAHKALVDGVHEYAEDYIADLPAVGGDLEEMVVSGVRRARQAVKRESGELFDKVDRLSDQLPTSDITLSGMRNNAKKVMDSLSPLAERLGKGTTAKRVQAIVDGTAEQSSEILGASGKKLVKPATMSFSELRALRSELGDLKRQAERAVINGGASEKDVGAIKHILSGLESDQKGWAKANKHLSEPWNEARKFYKEKYIDVYQSNSTIRKMMDEANFNPDTVAQRFLGSENQFLSNKLFTALDEDGKKAARYLMLSRAIHQVEEGNTKKAVKLLDFGKSGKVFFGKDELDNIAAMRKMVEKLGDKADPENLNRVTQLVFGGLGLATWLHSVAGGVAGTVAALGGANAAGVLNRAAPVRKFLTADSTIRGAGQAAQYAGQAAGLMGATRSPEIQERMQ